MSPVFAFFFVVYPCSMSSTFLAVLFCFLDDGRDDDDVFFRDFLAVLLEDSERSQSVFDPRPLCFSCSRC